MNFGKIMKEGIFTNNPVLVQLVGLCSVLAVTNTVFNSFSMGMAVTAVTIGSNAVISIFKNFIPGKVRIPAFIVVIATFVTIVEMVLEAYVPAVFSALGLFIPLIVVNCMILGRAEAFAYKNDLIPSIVDGLANGLGYTVSVVILGTLREIFGAGTFLAGTSMEMQVFGSSYQPIGVFIAPAGAFILLGFIVAGFNIISMKIKESK